MDGELFYLQNKLNKKSWKIKYKNSIQIQRMEKISFVLNIGKSAYIML